MARRRGRVIAVSAGVAVVAAGGGVAWAFTGAGGPDYRLATVTRSTVTQTVTTTGTVAAVNRATLRFPVSGTVAKVDVAVGDHVKAGETVASLDTTDLEQQLQSVQATLASARQTLADDAAAQVSGSSTNGTATTDSASLTELTAPARNVLTAATPGRSSSSSTAGLIAAVRAAQQKLLADQHAADLDADVAAADQAVLSENTACAALLDPTPTPTETPTSSASSASSASSSTGSSGTDLQACQDAITAVEQAQAKVQGDIHTLTGDEAALDDAVTALLQGLASSGAGGSSGGGGSGGSGNNGGTKAGGGSSQGSGSSSGRTGGSGSSGSNGSSGGNGSSGSNGNTVITAAQLAADQKKVDAASAQVTLAQQSLDQAALTSSISGTVAAVGVSTGASVSAGSSTQAITVIGPGQESVTTTVGINDIDLVKKGQTARVTVDGVATALTGRVALIGLLNTSGTSGSSTTYPVTIVLDGTPQLFDGAGASVSVAVGAATDVLTVPTSALHGTSTATTVDVYANGKVRAQRVTVGARGIDTVEVRSGLTAGERVVLAEVSAPVPSSDNQTNRFGRTGLGGGGLGGGGGAVLRGTGR